MRRYRSDLIIEVLLLLDSFRDTSINKGYYTNILYKCNLSAQNLKEIMTFLIKKGYVTYTPTLDKHRKGFYEITSKGSIALGDYKKYNNKVKELLR